MLRILWTILTHQPKSLRSNKTRKNLNYYDPFDHEMSEFGNKYGAYILFSVFVTVLVMDFLLGWL